jgi:hypothetical protein
MKTVSVFNVAMKVVGMVAGNSRVGQVRNEDMSATLYGAVTRGQASFLSQCLTVKRKRWCETLIMQGPGSTVIVLSR